MSSRDDFSVIWVAERFNVLREELNLLLDKSSIPLFDTSEMKREDRFYHFKSKWFVSCSATLTEPKNHNVNI